MASWSGGRPAVGDQPLGGRVEVVEDVLLVLAHAGAVPRPRPPRRRRAGWRSRRRRRPRPRRAPWRSSRASAGCRSRRSRRASSAAAGPGSFGRRDARTSAPWCRRRTCTPPAGRAPRVRRPCPGAVAHSDGLAGARVVAVDRRRRRRGRCSRTTPRGRPRGARRCRLTEPRPGSGTTSAECGSPVAQVVDGDLADRVPGPRRRAARRRSSSGAVEDRVALEHGLGVLGHEVGPVVGRRGRRASSRASRPRGRVAVGEDVDPAVAADLQRRCWRRRPPARPAGPAPRACDAVRSASHRSLRGAVPADAPTTATGRPSTPRRRSSSSCPARRRTPARPRAGSVPTRCSQTRRWILRLVRRAPAQAPAGVRSSRPRRRAARRRGSSAPGRSGRRPAAPVATSMTSSTDSSVPPSETW